MKNTNICLKCHRTEEEHQCDGFVPILKPNKCKCDPLDWRDATIPPICNYFEQHSDGTCVNCSHLEECHSKNFENLEWDL
jgi:hypothetical protein